MPLFVPPTARSPSSDVRRGVDHHGNVDVVERAQPHHLGLAAQKLELALFAEREALLELDVLLGRHGHQGHPSGQIGRDLAQCQASAEHRRDLRVVAAGVDRPGALVTLRVLPAQSESSSPSTATVGPGCAAVSNLGASAGQGDAVLVWQAEAVEPFMNQTGSAVLFEAQLGLVKDRAGKLLELVGVRVDGLAHARLERLN